MVFAIGLVGSLLLVASGKYWAVIMKGTNLRVMFFALSYPHAEITYEERVICSLTINLLSFLLPPWSGLASGLPGTQVLRLDGVRLLDLTITLLYT